MWQQFLLENVHFALYLFAGLVFFAVAWLYLDAWLARKRVKELLRIVGFLLLAASFLLQATFLESTLLTGAQQDGGLSYLVFTVLHTLGYGAVIISLILDPLQPKPTTTGINKQDFSVLGVSQPLFTITKVVLVYPALALLTGVLYIRRATVGLERHILPVGIAFMLLAVYELLSLSQMLRQTTNTDVYAWVAPFGPVWIAYHGVLFITVVVLGKWVSAYLLKRLQSQLFMIFTCTVLIIFLVTTVSFTFLLLKNLEDETLQRLATDVKVLSYAIDSKKAEALSDAQVLAQNVSVHEALKQGDTTKLLDVTQAYLLTKKQTTLIIVSSQGQVVARGEDRERIGDSLSDHPLIKRALNKKAVTSVVVSDGALTPEVSIQAAVPILDEGNLLGAVMMGTAADNALVDGIQKSTGLEGSVYGGAILSATTMKGADGTTRANGVSEGSTVVQETVLKKGQAYTGAVTLLNTPYFGAYTPLRDIDNIPVGMLFVGKPQITVLQAASQSIALTFVMAVIMLVVASIPSYIISQSLTKQLQ